MSEKASPVLFVFFVKTPASLMVLSTDALASLPNMPISLIDTP